MRQPATKPPIGCEIYPQSILRIFYRPTRLTHILDPLSILLIILVKTLLVRNFNSTL